MKSHVRPAIASFLLLTVITGIAYPLIVTAIARVAFPHQSAGSSIEFNGRLVGSELIAQPFSDPKYFWPRPSAANYDAAAGAGSNLGPTNPALAAAISQRTDAIRSAHPDQRGPVPNDLVMASASGLDPHISVEAAEYQAARVARVRGIPLEVVQGLIDACTQSRTLGVLGEARVNVLVLNLTLDYPELRTAATQPTSGPFLYRWRGFVPGK